MDVERLVEDYNRKRARPSSPPDRKRTGNPLYVDAIHIGAGLSSFVHSRTDYSRSAGEGPLREHSQYPFFRSLLGNTDNPNDPLSVLDIYGFPNADAYHDDRKKSLERRRRIQDALEEHAEVDRQLRTMTSPDAWETRAEGLVSEARSAKLVTPSTKPVRNVWVQSFDFLKTLSGYPDYQSVVNNYTTDSAALFELANDVAGELKERSSAFYFSAASMESPTTPKSVQAALRYIAWNVLFNGPNVAGLPGSADKKVLLSPFTQPPPDLPFYGPNANGGKPPSMQIQPVVDGDFFLSVLQQLGSKTPFEKRKGATELQAFFMDQTDEEIRKILAKTNTLVSKEEDVLVALDLRAEQLVSEKPDMKLSYSTAESAYPYLDTLENWIAKVFEPQRDELAKRALALVEDIKTSINNTPDAGETMWSRPIDLLEMSDLPVRKAEDLPFRASVLSAMDRVVSHINDFLRSQGRGSVTASYLRSSAGTRIAEKFAYATSRQMAAAVTRVPMTGIQRITSVTDTAAAIAEVCVAILEN